MSSYFFNGDIPKYHHSHKCLPYIGENKQLNTSRVNNTHAHKYKYGLLMRELSQWKDKPYGFQFRYDNIEYDDVHGYEIEEQTNYDIYTMLMDEIIAILEKHNKSITNFEQFEEDVMYYLYHILV